MCKVYVGNCDGESAGYIRTDGEWWLIRRVFKDFRRVFDVGANIGVWTRLALQVNPELEIHCFEPSRYTYGKLKENGFPAKVFCNPFGLGSKKEKRTLHVFEQGHGLNSLYNRDLKLEHPSASRETVHLETFEAYCKVKKIQNVDFIKIDVEGHELEVFRGMLNFLENGRVQMIQFEYGPCQIDSRVFLKDIFLFFSELPYIFFKILPFGLKKALHYKPEYENFRPQNWLLVEKNSPFLKFPDFNRF